MLEIGPCTASTAAGCDLGRHLPFGGGGVCNGYSPGGGCPGRCGTVANQAGGNAVEAAGDRVADVGSANTSVTALATPATLPELIDRPVSPSTKDE
jgi:hypothetical protein